MKKGAIFGLILLSFVLIGSFGVSAEDDILIKQDIENENLGSVYFKLADSREISCTLNRDDLDCKGYTAIYHQRMFNGSEGIFFNSSNSVIITIEDNPETISNSRFLRWIKLIQEDDSDELRGFRVVTLDDVDKSGTRNKVYGWVKNEDNSSGRMWYSGSKLILAESTSDSSDLDYLVSVYLGLYPSMLSSTVICEDNECSINDKCVPIGYIDNGEYCSSDGNLVSQLEADAQCNNNFECSSNLCIDNKCIEAGLFTKVINWFKNLLS